MKAILMLAMTICMSGCITFLEGFRRSSFQDYEYYEPSGGTTLPNPKTITPSYTSSRKCASDEYETPCGCFKKGNDAGTASPAC
jgi:hypothetical protein